MFWAFVLFAILAAGLVKLGALTVWVGVLSGALKLLCNEASSDSADVSQSCS